MAEVLSRMEDMVDELLTAGFGGLRERYLAKWRHSGERVQIERGEGGAREAATVTEINEQGYMVRG